MHVRLRAASTSAWLLAVVAAWAIATALSVARACELADDAVDTQANPACAGRLSHAGCCAAGGCTMAPRAQQPAGALLPAPGAPALAVAVRPARVTRAWPAPVVLVPPASVLPSSGAPPALDAVVLLI